MSSIRLALKRSLNASEEEDEEGERISSPLRNAKRSKPENSICIDKGAAIQSGKGNGKVIRAYDSSSEEGNEMGEKEDELHDGYGSDCYGDEEDRAKLMSLSEMQREEILYERGEKRKERLERRALKERISASRKAQGDMLPAKQGGQKQQLRGKTGRSAAAQYFSSSEEMSSEGSEDEGGTSSGYEHEEGDIVTESRREGGKLIEGKRRGGGKSNRSEDEVDSHQCGGTIHASGQGGVKKKDPKLVVSGGEEVGPSLFDINDCRVPRQSLEKWVNEPYFCEAVKDAFIKICVGNWEGKPVYRLSRVEGVSKYKRTYKLGNTHTDKALQLRFGSSVKQFRMDLVSNHTVNQREFDKWLTACIKGHVEVPGPKAIERKKEQVIQLTKFRKYTPEEVQSMVKHSQKNARGSTGNITSKIMKLEAELGCLRNRLVEEKKALQSARNYPPDESYDNGLESLETRVHETEGELQSLENNIQKLKAIDTARIENVPARTKASKISALNKRNTMANIDADLALSRQRNLNKASGKKEGVVADPFARRACRPKVLWAVKSKDSTNLGPNKEKSEPQDSKEAIEMTDVKSEMQSEPTDKQADGSLSGSENNRENLPLHLMPENPQAAPKLSKYHSFNEDVLEVTEQVVAELSKRLSKTSNNGGLGGVSKSACRKGSSMSLSEYLKRARARQEHPVE